MHPIRDAGGIVNSAILIAAATGIVLQRDPCSLAINGDIGERVGEMFLHKIGLVKRKTTTKSKVIIL